MTGIGLAVAAGTLPPEWRSTATPITPPERTTIPSSDPSERTATSPNPQRSPVADPVPTAQVKTAPVVPPRGSGRFATAPGVSRASGPLPVTYTVEVELELEVDPSDFAARVDATLAHPKGWRAFADHEFQRVENDPQIRILLTTPGTVDRLCAPLDTGGELSCRNLDLVVINAKRWLLGADTYQGDLEKYRRYVLNHEVGHALGYPHQRCPEDGSPAPVMLQQTISLDGCASNPWPVNDPAH